jgi:divalent metal cation (Fe/Co/Zn/Cd) transporter
MSTSQAHAVASEVEYQVCQISPEIVDTIVHIEPSYLERSSDWEKISYGLRSIAEGIGLSLHDLHVHVNQEGEFTIELDLEIQGEVTLKEAHEFADEFEERAIRFWPDAKQIVTHLEPASRKLLYPSSKADGNLTQRVRDYLYLIMNPIGKILVQSLVIEDHLSVYVKFSMPAEISLDESHARVEEIKRSLMQEFPEISRINIHVEPWSGEVAD